MILAALLITLVFSLPRSPLLDSQLRPFIAHTIASQALTAECCFTCDGLGRLIRKETPVSAGVTALQVKDLYYDGVRRIQETIARPPVIQQQQGAASNATASISAFTLS